MKEFKWSPIMTDILEERQIPPFSLKKKVIPKGTNLDLYDPARGLIYKDSYPKDFPIVILQEDGEVWMSDTPFEQEGIVIPVALAKGHVLTSGLGLGLFPHLVTYKQEVKVVDIVEKEEKVIKLVFDQIKTPKMRVIQDDIYHYLETIPTRYDFIYLDVWADYIGPIKDVDRAVSLAQKCLKPGGEVRVWLQELISRVKHKLPKVPTPPGPVGLHPPCLICSKVLRNDYAGLCMDCADSLGVSELFIGK